MLRWYSAKVIKVVETKTKKALEETGKEIETEAKNNCPVKSGHLRSTIHSDMVNDTTVKIEASASYALPVELGTSKSPARPYMRPALWHKAPGILKKLKGTL